MTTTVTQTASIALGAYLIGVVDYRAVLLVEAVVVVVAALLLFRAGRFAEPPVGSGHNGGHDDRARAGARRAAGASPSARS
ncbi:hypothetical protein ACH495_07490 [Micromonospora sp. NPDC018662]|uniref:hypothetical protein n=1 Tax=Micromonospora sp. NPDC018662 TaxID=3364238 RepID=UPI00378F4DB0